MKSTYHYFLFVILISTTQGFSQTLLPIGNGLQEFEDDRAFFGMHIEKLNGEYFIGGKFDLADSIPVNNMTTWDGEKFRDASSGINESVQDLFIVNNELYLFESEPHKLKKWNGTSWEWLFVNGIINGRYIQNDTLYLYGHKLSYRGSEESSVLRLTLDNWEGIDINWPLSARELEGFAIYNNNMFLSYSRNTYKLDSLRTPVLSIEEEGRLTNIQEKLFLTVERDSIYEYVDNEFNALIEVDSRRNNLFVMNEELYYGELNEGTYRYEQDNFVQVIGSSLAIMDVEKHNNDEYILVGRLWSGSEITDESILNDIAIAKIEEPQSTINEIPDTICENEYLFLGVNDNDLSVIYDWKTTGGVPRTSHWRYPVIKYPEPGQYDISLKAHNFIDSIDEINKTITVIGGCAVEREKRYDNVWINGAPLGIPGTTAGLDFSNGGPNPTSFNITTSPRGMFNTICDKDGNLLFYSNGLQIADSEHEIIAGSEGFNTGEFHEESGDIAYTTQSFITIPSNENDSLFYLFHSPIERIGEENIILPESLLLSEVHLTSTGKLEMKLKAFPIILDTLFNYTMQAHPHSNGDDWWILAFKYKSDEYYKVLLRKNGTIEVEKDSHGITLTNTGFQSAFSPNGQYFVMPAIELDNRQSYLWTFNNTTGTLSHPVLITHNQLDFSDSPIGYAFSPNSRYLYISYNDYINQYDLCQEDINNTHITVSDYIPYSYPSFGKMMLAPDGKIYVCPFSFTSSLSTIHNPNELGLSCDFRKHDLAPIDGNYFEVNSIPHFPHYRNTTDTLDCTITNVINQSIDDPLAIELYPNPASDFIGLRFNTEIVNLNFKVYSVDGQLVSTKKGNQNSFQTIEVSALNSGTYFLEITVGGKRIIKQFMKE